MIRIPFLRALDVERRAIGLGLTFLLLTGSTASICRRPAHAEGASAPPAASTMSRRSVAEALQASSELVTLAEAVVRGTVLGADSYWSPDRTMIYTRYQVRVDAVIAGGADSVIELTTEGGQVGDIGLRVSGSPDLAPGVPYLLLLGDAPGYLCVLGGASGRFPLTDEDARNKDFDSEIARAVDEIRKGGSDEKR